MPMSFRLNGRQYACEACVALYRGADVEAMTTNHLFLTRDGRFAYLAQVIGGVGVYAAEEWDHPQAMRFLRQHGEGDIVDEFPDVFRKRAMTTPKAAPKERKVAPPGHSAEAFLFPL